MTAVNVARFGTGTPPESGGEAGGPVGLPLPSLALEVLVGSTALQLGRIYGIAGSPQSFKSMLALELSRTVAVRGGITCLCETEGGKISSGIVASVYGELVDRLDIRSVDGVERAQAALTCPVKWLKQRYPERDVFLALVLDSLNGSSSDVRHRAIQERGHASRDYPIETLLWNRFLLK